MSTYFLLDPFEFPYYFYRIRGELIYVLTIVVCIPNTLCPTLGHNQGSIYFQSALIFMSCIISTQFKSKYGLIVKNISISTYSV